MRRLLIAVSVILAVLAISIAHAVSQVNTAPPTPPWNPVATFSILGFDPDTREIGAAVQSRVFSVGNGVLWAEAEVGAVATQAIVDVSYGPKGIELLKNGIAPSGPSRGGSSPSSTREVKWLPIRVPRQVRGPETSRASTARLKATSSPG